jgi:hypothetical protein
MRTNLKMRSLALPTILLVLSASCEYYRYEIEMAPTARPHGFRRKLTLKRLESKQSSNTQAKSLQKIDPEFLEPIAKLYNKQLETRDESRAFVGEFAESTPSDVGGAGSFYHLSSSLGDFFAYSERFRGDDDLAGQVAAMQAAADELTDLLIGWFVTELKDDPRWPVLKEFLNRSFRNDIKSTALYVWRLFSDSRVDEEFGHETAARIARYLAEREYVHWRHAPEVFKAIAESHELDSHGKSMALIQRMVARRMGVGRDEPIPDSLAFLRTDDAALASLREYAKTTERYKELIVWWETERQKDPQREKPKPEYVFAAIIQDSLPLQIRVFNPPDEVSVRLAAEVDPFATNGEWKPEAKRIVWDGPIHGEKGLPTFYYAVWAPPNIERQTALFGRVGLSGETLVIYMFWWAGLSDAERSEWDAMLDSLKPGETSAIETFRFSTDPVVDESEVAASMAEAVKQLLIDGMNPADEE